jgi:hypothetical protein
MCYIIMYQYRDYHFLSYMDYSIVHVKHSFAVWNIPVVLSNMDYSIVHVKHSFAVWNIPVVLSNYSVVACYFKCLVPSILYRES